MDDQTPVTANGRKSAAFLPPIIAIVAAVLLCASYFLPFTVAKDGSIARSEYAKSYEVNEGSGVTMADLVSPSIITWARFYKAYCDSLEKPVTSSLNDYSLVFWVIVASGAAAALALLFALLRKAIPTALLALANLGLVSFVGYYFEEYGPVSSSAESVWAFGRIVMLGSAVTLAAAAVWLFIVKRAEKRSSASA